MAATSITCPKCLANFTLDEGITRAMERDIKAQFDRAAAEREAEFRKRVGSLDEREAALRVKGEEVEKLIRDAVEQRQVSIRMEQKQIAEAAVAASVKELNDRLAAREARLRQAEENELLLRKERDEFEQRKASFELELVRARDAIREEVAKAKDEEYRLREKEKEMLVSDLKLQLDEMRRRAEQGSQQAQGEALEVDLESTLKQLFAHDRIEPVGKGVSGADLLQRVCTAGGQECGTILWESKRTRTWNNEWIDKLKQDKRTARASAAVIVSVTLPKDANQFDCRDGIWITSPALAGPVCSALRAGLIETAAARRAVAGRVDKSVAVYDYLSGPDFRDRIQAIVETFRTLQDDLDRERRAVTSLWAKREQQIRRLSSTTAQLYGELHAIIGSEMHVIGQLDLPYPDPEKPALPPGGKS